MRSSDLLDLVAKVHGTVFSDDGWRDFACELERTIPGSSVSLILPLDADLSVLEAVELDRRGVPDVIEWHSPSSPPEFYQPFIERFRFESENPFLIPRVVPPGTGIVRRTDELISLKDFSRSPMFNDWMKPQELGIGPNLVAFLREGVPDIPTLHLFRRRRRRPFGESEHRAIQVLIPHMQQAVRAKACLRATAAVRDSLLEVLDRLTLGVILLDAKGQLCAVNRAAREVLEARDGLEVFRGELRAATPEKTKHLHDLVARAGASSTTIGTIPGGALNLPRFDKRELVALVTPLQTGSGSQQARVPSSAVFLTDCGFDTAAAIEILRTIYDLTPREAQLAVEIAGGRSLAGAAETFGTMVSTERSRLRDIFEKTGTERQGELVRLVLREATQLTHRR